MYSKYINKTNIHECNKEHNKMNMKDNETLGIVILSKDNIKSIRNGNILTKDVSNGDTITICSEKSYNVIDKVNPKLIISEKVIYISDDDIISMLLNDKFITYRSKLFNAIYRIYLDSVYEGLLIL